MHGLLMCLLMSFVEQLKAAKCKCGNPARPGQRTCRKCHAAFMKNWRNDRVFVKKSDLVEILK